MVLTQTATFQRGALDSDPVFGRRVCLPCLVDIGLETTHGCRRVTAAEWMMLKGFKKGTPTLPLSTVLRCPSNHLWAAIGKRVMPLLFFTTALEQTFLNRYDSEQGPGGATSDREKGTPALSSKNTVNGWTW